MLIKLADNLNNSDVIKSGPTSPFVRTKIVGGYDAYTDKKGFTQFGEKLFETENMIVLGGSLFTLEKLFGIKSSLKVAYLNDIMGIATDSMGGEIINDSTHPVENDTVCLFGVGIGGAGESITDVKDVHYYDREIFDMIPLRQTADELTTEEAAKYWFKKPINVDGISKTQYYLKTFDSVKTHVLWRDSSDDSEDGSEVTGDVHTTTSNIPIETFVEMILKISKKDIREYFDDNGNIESARINSIGLFSGIKAGIGSPVNGVYPDLDYKRVKLFSKLNINNEMLNLSKDLTIAYRIYTS